MMVDEVNLYEFKRIVCCSTENRSFIRRCDGVDAVGELSCPHTVIRCCTWTSNTSNTLDCLALYLSNDIIVLYRPSQCKNEKPSVRQIPWYSNSSKHVMAMAFSCDGSWLLIAAKDSTVYIIPSLKLMDPLADVEPRWPLGDITEIKVQGRRASPTAIVWWETRDGRSIAVIGNELGEISFINLLLNREVGGTYITIAIQNIELVEDTVNCLVYLLITGSNRAQWQLILEKDELEYCWPLESNSLSYKEEKSGLFASCEGKRPVAEATKSEDTRPKRLDTFAGHTFLQLQESLESNCISGYYHQTSVISIHTPDFNIVPLMVYKVPVDAIKFIVQEGVIFAVSPLEFDVDLKYAVQIISTELATSTIDGHKEFDPNARLQYFYLDSDEELLSMISFSSLHCIIVTSKNVYHLSPRVDVEEMFMQIVLQEGDIAKAERFGKLYDLNISAAYEKAADQKLAEGMVTAAIRLYQTAKCPHIQNVAKFAAHGHVSEVLSYIRILYANKNNTFPIGELIQFSNMAFMCYLQQCLEHSLGCKPYINNFRVFLKENQYYDEKMAVQMLAKYQMYDLLMELADFRGLFSYVMEALLPSEEEISLWSDTEARTKPSWMDEATATVLVECGYQNLACLESNDLFVECLLHKNLSECFVLREDLLWQHMKLMEHMRVSWNDRPDLIRRLLVVYSAAVLNFASSLVKNCSDSAYDQLYKDLQNSEVSRKKPNLLLEVATYFVKLIVFVIKFDTQLLAYKSTLIMPSLPILNPEMDNGTTQATYLLKRRLVSSGYAHSAVAAKGAIYTWGRAQDGCLGRGPHRHEWLPAEPLTILQNANIRVHSVACGAAHTVAVTDAGVFAWGSNRYGQLGLGKAAPTGMWCRRSQPTAVASLSDIQLCDISCGQYHTLALSAEGAVWTWGWGVHGQLGHGNALDYDTPTQVIALKDEVVVSVSGGYGHSLFQTKEGDVYVCGCGTFGQLATGIACKRSLPIKVPIDEKVVLSSAGYFHNVVVGTSGKLITWGCNPQTLRLRAQASRRARIVIQASGGGATMPCEPPSDCIADITSTPGVFNPVDVDREAITAPISQISCGANHTLLLTIDGDLFSWGRNLDGQLGVENRKERLSPAAIVVLNDRKIVQMSCGADFTILLDNAGKLWGFGVDSYGQICGAAERGKWSQPNAAMSPSKIITVRTNRRVVQIKSPTRTSVYKPLLLNGIPQIYDTKDSCERIKLVIGSLIKKLNFECMDDNFNYSLHYALELLHNGYDSGTIKSVCIESELWQAAAKVALMSKCFLQSFEFNLKCIATSSGVTICSALLDLLEIYIGLTKADLICQREILNAAISFWLSLLLPLDVLENYFKKTISSILVPLSYIVFGIANETEENCQLTTQFCFDVVQLIMEKVNEGELDPDFMQLINDISHPQLDTCQDKVENIAGEMISSNLEEDCSQKSYIDISSNELDRLRRILPNTAVGDGGKSSSVIKVFTCGHLHTLSSFHRTALPILKDSLNYVAPSVAKQLANHYANLDFQPMACPKCLVVGFHRDRLELAQMTT